jgi:hypothetical protein
MADHRQRNGAFTGGGIISRTMVHLQMTRQGEEESRFSDKRPPDIEEKDNPGDESDRIALPVRFTSRHAVFVNFPDG